MSYIQMRRLMRESKTDVGGGGRGVRNVLKDSYGTKNNKTEEGITMFWWVQLYKLYSIIHVNHQPQQFRFITNLKHIRITKPEMTILRFFYVMHIPLCTNSLPPQTFSLFSSGFGLGCVCSCETDKTAIHIKIALHSLVHWKDISYFLTCVSSHQNVNVYEIASW